MGKTGLVRDGRAGKRLMEGETAHYFDNLR
jgi:hypothetical protein